MTAYGTIEEKAAEWNVSVRHIQYLCRTGKINGAVKRARAWFIPVDATVPLKNTKVLTNDFILVGTKSRIFNSAVELFLQSGFEQVRYRDIAARAGIRPSAIYYHFKTKEDILDTVYAFYRHHFIANRYGIDEMSHIWQNNSLLDIFNGIRYEFKPAYQQTMFNITLLIFQRLGMDERAKKIAGTLITEEGIRYVENIFDDAIKGGRLMAFDTRTMAIFINAVRIFTLFYWIVEQRPEYRAKLMEDEQRLYRYAAGLLTDLSVSQ